MKYFLRRNNSALFDGQTEQKHCVVCILFVLSFYIWAGL